MQTTEFFGSASVGAFAAAAAFFAQYGSSGPAVMAALVGAVLAVMEIEDARFRGLAALLVFNIMSGVLGGAILTHWMQAKGWLDHPAVLVGLSFVVAYLAHDFMRGLKPTILNFIAGLLSQNDRGGPK